MRRLLLSVFVLTALPCLLVACTPGGGQRVCTEIGCTSVITLTLRGPDDQIATKAAGTAKAGGKTWTFDCGAPKSPDDYSFDCSPEGLVFLYQPLDAPSLVLDLRALSAAGGPLSYKGEQPLTLEKSQPNGPDCPPICYEDQLVVAMTASP